MYKPKKLNKLSISSIKSSKLGDKNSSPNNLKRKHDSSKTNKEDASNPVRMVMLTGAKVSKKIKKQLKENAKKQEENSKKQKTEISNVPIAINSKPIKNTGKLLTKHLVQSPYQFFIPSFESELENSFVTEFVRSLQAEEKQDTSKSSFPADLLIGFNSVIRILQKFASNTEASSSPPPLRLVITCSSDAKLQPLVQPLHMIGAVLSTSSNFGMLSLSSEAEARISKTLKIPHTLVIGIKTGSKKFERVCEIFEQANIKNTSGWINNIANRPSTYLPMSLKRVEIPAPPPKKKNNTQLPSK